MKFQGTVEQVRELEKTVEIARTSGKIVIGREAKRQTPFQGKDIESSAFSRTYEVYLSNNVKSWEDHAGGFMELIITMPVKIRFWYEYRMNDNRKGMAQVKISNGNTKPLCKMIPGFRQALIKLTSVRH